MFLEDNTSVEQFNLIFSFLKDLIFNLDQRLRKNKSKQHKEKRKRKIKNKRNKRKKKFNLHNKRDKL